MSSREKTLLWVVAAGLLGLGVARWPAPGVEEHRPLLITSSIGAQSSILFVLDPVTQNLAAYEAIPGNTPNDGLRLLGARKITHDLDLVKYRDLSEYSYFELRDKKNEPDGTTDGEKKAGGGEKR